MQKNDYKYYQLEDFLIDEEFKVWVLKADPKLDLFWKKMMESYPEKKIDILKAKELLTLMKFNQNNVKDEEKDNALVKILQQAKSNFYLEELSELKRKYATVDIDWWLKIAASISIFICSFVLVYYISKNSIVVEKPIVTITKSNPAGKKLTFHLPDGSSVTLNSESSISYPEIFSNEARTVSLEGEAFFEVEHNVDLPFLVKTGNVTTKVLGTSFNVKAYPNTQEFTVALLEGKVNVIVESNNKQKEIILSPLDKVVVDVVNDKTYTTSFDEEYEFGWKDGILIFDSDDHESVIAKMKRWYGVDFELLNKPSTPWKIKGPFHNKSLTQLLDYFVYTHKIEYQYVKEENKVKIKFD